jgi:hypothetical protein
MFADGPAIKGVSVAERMEAGAVSLNRGRVPVPAVTSLITFIVRVMGRYLFFFFADISCASI